MLIGKITWSIAASANYGLNNENDEEDPQALWENIVCTFNVCPNTPYKNAGFNFDTYGLLRVARDYSDWRLEVIRQEMFTE